MSTPPTVPAGCFKRLAIPAADAAFLLALKRRRK